MKIAAEQTPSYYEIPNRRVNGFLGREDILQKIDKALSDQSSPHYAVLQGMGGQGKTQVALEYCHRKKNNPYSAIFWVDATTQDRVEGSFQSISERIKRPTDNLPDVKAQVAFVLRVLTSWTVHWLMVFDNYDNPNTFPNIRDFIPQSEFGAILVTSRHPDSRAFVIEQSNHYIELFGLEEDAAIALLIQQSQTKQGITLDAKSIVERLGYHPLAITQAGAYIRKRKLRLSEFMDHYKRRRKIILESTPQLSQYRKRLDNAEEETSLNVFTTWELSFRELRSEASKDGVEAKLLTLLAYFNEKDISEQLFAGFNVNQEHIFESATLLTWLKAFLSTDGDQWDSDLFGDVLIRLTDSSLLQTFERGLDGFYHASLHPLIKDWIRLRIDQSMSRENICAAAILVSKILVESWQNQHFDLPLRVKQDITSHIITLEESHQEFFIPQPSISSDQKIFDEYTISQFWFARFLVDTGSYHLAKTLCQRLITQTEKDLGLEHPTTLTSMTDLASTHRNQGRWKEAEELEALVMATSSRVLGLEHPSTLVTMNNRAITFWNQGRWKEAEKLQVQVMETSSRLLGLEHPSTLGSIANLAFTFMNQGRWKEAEELNVQVMEISSRVFGLEQPSTLTSMANLGSTYRYQGRWKEAKELQVQVMETRSRVLGLEHPSTLISTANLALTLMNQGRWKEAEELQVQVMEKSSRVLGLEHPDTLTSMGNLASTYRNQGLWKEAEDLQLQVMETSSRLLGLEHPSTLSSIANLALTFMNQGRWNEAEELNVQVMETSSRVLGLEHPDTLTSMANLASTHRNKGRWKEAEELQMQVVETSSRVLGLEHASTLNSMTNLALAFSNQNRWKEAKELELQVMETSSRVLGPEHPSTLASMNNLACTFWSLDSKKEAIQLMTEVVQFRQKTITSDHPHTIQSACTLLEWQDKIQKEGSG